MIDFEKMQAKANLYGVQLSSVQLSQLDKYADFAKLKQANRTMIIQRTNKDHTKIVQRSYKKTASEGSLFILVIFQYLMLCN